MAGLGNLVAQPEVEIAALLAYLNLPWSDSCLAFHETKRVQATASYAQVNQPMYATAVGLVIYGAKYGKKGKKFRIRDSNIFHRVRSRMKKWFRDVI